MKKIKEEKSVSNNGNLFNERPEKIRKRIEDFLKFSTETNVMVIKDQYLAHVEYWEGVLQNIQH